MQRRHDPTYYLATRCLPRDVRPAVHALYGFVRGADEIVDGPRPPAGAPRRAALDAWQAELERGLAGGRSDHPVIAALVDAGPRHGLPLQLLARYMDSMRVDCDEPRADRRARELDDYMEGSAATVGRVMAPLLGAPPTRDVARLGVAFQLTNFIRDVPIDWDLDRVYLPGLPEDDLRAGAASERPRARRAGGRAGPRPVRRHRRRRARAGPGDAPRRARRPRGLRPGARSRRAQRLRRARRAGALLRPWEAARAALGR